MPQSNEPTADLQDAQRGQEEEEAAHGRICTACGGSALSPYPDDGGSCPHCFNGYVR